jgi:siroheme synthase (precorrin-2 oxidase/ferrochelatase)
MHVSAPPGICLKKTCPNPPAQQLFSPVFSAYTFSRIANHLLRTGRYFAGAPPIHRCLTVFVIETEGYIQDENARMSLNTKTKSSDQGKILIIGGYGQVGSDIATRLAPLFPDRVVIAGRNLEKAQAAATATGHGSSARIVDIFAASAADALTDVGLVMVCIDQTGTGFVETCLSRGINYLDISAEYNFLSRIEPLAPLARENGATAMLSVGTSPGLTNMLAARIKQQMPDATRIDILLETGLGDQHGRAAVEWMFDNLDTEFEVMEAGRPKKVRGFGDKIDFQLRKGDRARPAFRFNFSDQHAIARTLDLQGAATWVRFEHKFTTSLFALSSRAGLGRLLRRPRWRRAAVWLMMNVHVGSDICAVAARGTNADGSKTLTLNVVGRREALMTAVIAAETARQMLTEPFDPGVFHSEQAVKLEPVISALKAELPDLTADL